MGLDPIPDLLSCGLLKRFALSRWKNIHLLRNSRVCVVKPCSAQEAAPLFAGRVGHLLGDTMVEMLYFRDAMVRSPLRSSAVGGPYNSADDVSKACTRRRTA